MNTASYKGKEVAAFLTTWKTELEQEMEIQE